MALNTTTILADLFTTIIAQETRRALDSSGDATLWPSGDFGRASLVPAGNVTGSGGLAVKQVFLDLGNVEMASTAEGASTSSTSLSPSTATVTVARQALEYDFTDQVAIADDKMLLQQVPPGLAMAARKRFTSMVAALSTGFSNTAGATGTALSVSSWLTAIATLEIAGVDGPIFALLHPKQVRDLRSSLRSETGPIAYQREDAARFLGRGIESLLDVPILKSGRVPLSGIDRYGMMWSPGAILYALATPINPLGAANMAIADFVSVELDRDAAGASTSLVGNLWAGVAEGEDSRGVGIISAD